MRYALFRSPGCNDGLGQYLNKMGIDHEKYDVTSPKGNKEFNYYYSFIKGGLIKDSHLEIVFPIVLLLEENAVREIIQDKESLKECILRGNR